MAMSWFESWLTRLETRLKEIFEGQAEKMAIPKSLLDQLLQSLIRAIAVNIEGIPDENDPEMLGGLVPDQFTLILPPAQAQLLLDHPEALDQLASRIQIFAIQSHLTLAAPPLLRVVADPQTTTVLVKCSQSKLKAGKSSTLELDGMPHGGENQSSTQKIAAYLIVNGLSTFHLSHRVINIGSDPGNQLVLTDLGVSRWHAQLRLSNGHYAIFDLDSTEGTRVNGVVVTNRTLNPGDVILLAKVPLVYGEETASRQGFTQKVPAGPPPPEVL